MVATNEVEMNRLSMHPQVWRPWMCTSRLVMFFLVTLSVPTVVAADATDRWQALTDAGTVAREQARYKEAEQFFLMADQEAQGFGPNDRRRGSSLNNVGLVFHEQGQYECAKSYYERALLLWEQALGPVH
jgi:tetratricopeptide (TPR) repeat protein